MEIRLHFRDARSQTLTAEQSKHPGYPAQCSLTTSSRRSLQAGSQTRTPSAKPSRTSASTHGPVQQAARIPRPRGRNAKAAADVDRSISVSVSDLPPAPPPDPKRSLHNSRFPPFVMRRSPQARFDGGIGGRRGLHRAEPVSVGSPALARVEAPGPAPASQIRVAGGGVWRGGVVW